MNAVAQSQEVKKPAREITTAFQDFKIPKEQRGIARFQQLAGYAEESDQTKLCKAVIDTNNPNGNRYSRFLAVAKIEFQFTSSEKDCIRVTGEPGQGIDLRIYKNGRMTGEAPREVKLGLKPRYERVAIDRDTGKEVVIGYSTRGTYDINSIGYTISKDKTEARLPKIPE